MRSVLKPINKIMDYIEICDENENVLYRGETVGFGRETYTFNDLLTTKEITVREGEFPRIGLFSTEAYKNIVSYLHKLKETDRLTHAEKQELYKSVDLIDDFRNKIILIALGIGCDYKSVQDVPITILHESIVKLVDDRLKASIESFDDLIKNETNEEIIAEIISAKEDVINNVKEFIELEVPSITIDNFAEKWPTLLNPSPIQQAII